MDIKGQLAAVVGKDNISDEPGILESYSSDYSLTTPGKAGCVVYPENTAQIAEVVKLCNRDSFPIIPCSSRVHFRGCTIPKQGGAILDLRRMNKIESYNERNRYVAIQPGVTWRQIQDDLVGRESMVSSPLLPHGDQSVVTTFLERDPLVIALFEYNEPLMSMEVVWPDGSVFRTGSASAPNFPKTFVEGTNPMGPGTLDFYRLLQGAQGTMGIVTWAMVKTEYLSPTSKVFFMGFDRVEEAIEPLYWILRKKIGYECFLMNRLELACILAEDGGEELEAMKETVPEWTVVVILRSARRRPEEKFAYEEEALMKLRRDFFGVEVMPSLPGLPNAGNQLSQMLRKPWSGEPYWKHRYQGNCQELFFVSKMTDVPEYVDIMLTIAGRNGFPVSRLGCYVQPIDNGRACHCEFDLFYDQQDSAQVAVVDRVMKEGAAHLLNRGAFFSRPYGDLSDMVYARAADYTAALKKVKAIFDPNNILNPGNLCF
ncbi:MAG: FAD-binding oxidoreductase [Deltaproteobacteria bacterium]